MGELYETTREHWPMSGKVILAQHDKTLDAVCLYQAFKPEIADYAVQHQKFAGCPSYSTTRMTWVKTNFLWMMFRSGWGKKPNQQRILAIWVHREAFERYLSQARTRGAKPLGGDNVRLQWDPDHYPDGSCHLTRRAVQLGLKNIAGFADGSDIARIEDISDFVHEQGKIRKSDPLKLKVARERVYHPEEGMSVFD